MGGLNFIEVGIEIGVKEDHQLLEALRLMIQANFLIIEVTLKKKMFKQMKNMGSLMHTE